MKKFWTKLMSAVLALCFTLSGLGTVPVFAMEYTETETEENFENWTLLATGTPEDGVLDLDIPVAYAGNDEFKYGVTTAVGGFTCEDYNLTPMKSVESDSRIHRLVVKVQFKKSLDDRGNGDMRLDVYLRRANTTTDIAMGMQSGLNVSTNTLTPVTFQTNWISVSPGEHFQFKFDACTNNSADANGNVRTAEIEQYWVYCD